MTFTFTTYTPHELESYCFVCFTVSTFQPSSDSSFTPLLTLPSMNSLKDKVIMYGA